MSSAARKSSSLWGIFGILFLIFFLYVIYSANQGTLPFFIRRLYVFPGGDKLGHFILLGISSFFANQLLHPRHFLVFGKVFFVGTLILLVVVTAEEASQIFISNRTFDLIDLSFSYLWIIAVRFLKKEAGCGLVTEGKSFFLLKKSANYKLADSGV